jgi:hypothetical protein
MQLITAKTDHCAYCPTALDEDEDDDRRDSNGDRVCAICYTDGTAYVEPLDFELDGGQ